MREGGLSPTVRVAFLSTTMLPAAVVVNTVRNQPSKTPAGQVETSSRPAEAASLVMALIANYQSSTHGTATCLLIVRQDLRKSAIRSLIFPNKKNLEFLINFTT